MLTHVAHRSIFSAYAFPLCINVCATVSFWNKDTYLVSLQRFECCGMQSPWCNRTSRPKGNREATSSKVRSLKSHAYSKQAE